MQSVQLFHKTPSYLTPHYSSKSKGSLEGEIFAPNKARDLTCPQHERERARAGGRQTYITRVNKYRERNRGK